MMYVASVFHQHRTGARRLTGTPDYRVGLLARQLWGYRSGGAADVRVIAERRTSRYVVFRSPK
jgi:hypothetical protein